MDFISHAANSNKLVDMLGMFHYEGILGHDLTHQRKVSQ